jgi:phytoene dehydrogenase-like protein
LSAAISLAQQGYGVTVHEKNARIGGKLNVLNESGVQLRPGSIHSCAASPLRPTLRAQRQADGLTCAGIPAWGGGEGGRLQLVLRQDRVLL